MRERIWERITTPGACFAIGIVIGIFFMNIQKSILLTGGDLLSVESLKRITEIGAGGSALFAYVLRKRGAQFLLLAVFATTYLGVAACAVAAGWYGFSCGVFLTAGVLWSEGSFARAGGNISTIFFLCACLMRAF